MKATNYSSAFYSDIGVSRDVTSYLSRVGLLSGVGYHKTLGPGEVVMRVSAGTEMNYLTSFLGDVDDYVSKSEVEFTNLLIRSTLGYAYTINDKLDVEGMMGLELGYGAESSVDRYRLGLGLSYSL